MTTRQNGIEFGGERLLLDPKKSADYEVIDSLRLGMELVRNSESEVPEGFNGLAADASLENETKAATSALSENVQEIGDSAAVASLPVDARARISGAYRTSLAVFEGEVQTVLDVLQAAEVEAEEKPQLKIPHGFFRSSIEHLSSEDFKRTHKKAVEPIQLKPRLSKVEGGGETTPSRAALEAA